MKKLPHLTLSLVLALAGFSTARADTIHSGSFTADITKTGGMTAYVPYGSPGTIGFGHEWLSGGAIQESYVQVSGTMTATFQADPGLIFDKFYFHGITGALTVSRANGLYAEFTWRVIGGAFTGPATYGGHASAEERSEWEITGPNTGRSITYDGRWDATVMRGDSGPTGSGFYSIGASSFSIEWSAVVAVYGAGGGIAPQGHPFSFSYLDAPPPTSSVPETGATAGLMLLGLAGMAGVRRVAHGASGATTS